MIAAGIDLGGSKIEAQIFNAEWTCVDRLRVKTPTTYDSLLQTLQEAIDWIEGQDGNIPIGIGSAGLIVPQTGIALTANLPATGKSFQKTLPRGRVVRSPMSMTVAPLPCPKLFLAAVASMMS